MNKIEDFLKNAEKIIILFHIDTDGICSAKIVNESLKRLNKKVLDYFPTSPQLLKSKTFQIGIVRDNPDLIILVDISVDDDEPLIKNNKGRKFLIIDHHQVTKDLSNDNIIHINPKLSGDETYTPASKVCFDELNKVIDIEDLDWVSAVGIIGDTGGIFQKKFITKTLKKYKYAVKNDKDYFFDSFFGELSNIINSAKMCKGNDGAIKALKLIEESSTPNEFFEKAFELRMCNEQVEQYINDSVELFEKSKEYLKDLDLYFFTFSPKYLIGSTLSTILSFKYPAKTLVILTKKGNNTTVNFRRHDKTYDMGQLAKESVQGLKNAGGGGHIPAAGAHLQSKDVLTLKNNIMKKLGDMMHK
ncbi:DHH family protein [Candidatus Tiddalikarchaeum anstoanum]|nr:DHH family protein [Candidatus Tiddalikarchaeum anstoanum]